MVGTGGPLAGCLVSERPSLHILGLNICIVLRVGCFLEGFIVGRLHIDLSAVLCAFAFDPAVGAQVCPLKPAPQYGSPRSGLRQCAVQPPGRAGPAIGRFYSWLQEHL